jgi:hypothetical protein
MSAIGTKRTCRVALHMSAYGGKAYIVSALNSRAQLYLIGLSVVAGYRRLNSL